MPKPFFTRRIPRLILVLLVVFLLIQFIRPSLDNPPVTGDLKAPPEVKAILKRACYDCHSNETSLLWYDQPVPVIWLVAADVKKGRSLLNFSHWDSLTADQQKGKLFECLNQVVFNSMPLSQYTALHGNAHIAADDISVLRNYLASLAHNKPADSAKYHGANAQYLHWTTGLTGPASGPTGSAASNSLSGSTPASGPNTVSPELNGLAYLPEYKDWQAISSTERWDNGTMRIILGNPVAVRAIREGRTHPWPDGTAFAKVAWDQLADTAGLVSAGEFKQVELMIKDQQKYASTDGWGWGRWKGMALKPYGSNANFTTECTNCHQPMHDFDYVFSSPVDWRARGGAGSDTTAFDPLGWKVIGSRIDKAQKTMSTLYGNDIALAAARKGITGAYPPGAVLALVTWKQKEDDHWFGANIPAAIQSVQKISFGAGPGAVSYDNFTGSPLKKEPSVSDSSIARSAIRFIAAQRASVMP